MDDFNHDQAAVEKGRRNAAKVLAQRSAVLALRAEQLTSKRESYASGGASWPIDVQALFSPAPSAGWVVVEGDSWFGLGRSELIAILDDPPYNFDIRNVTSMGEGVEGMSSELQLTEYCRELEKMLRSGLSPKAILLSGGGSDLVDQRLGGLLNHADSGCEALNQLALARHIDGMMRRSLITAISQLTYVSEHLFNRRLPILIHGYDYLIPDGRFADDIVSSSWLFSVLERHGYRDLQQRIQIVKQLVDRLNAMLADLNCVAGLEHVTHVDLRNALPASVDNYRTYWHNELQPTQDALRMLAERVAAALAKV